MVNRLSTFNLSSSLTKGEFVNILSGYPVATIQGLRESLYQELCYLKLLSDEHMNLPLVTQKNSVSRPVEKALSDCWVIVDCIMRKCNLPHVLLKNGKRDGCTVANQPRISILSTIINPSPLTTSATEPMNNTVQNTSPTEPVNSIPQNTSTFPNSNLVKSQIG